MKKRLATILLSGVMVFSLRDVGAQGVVLFANHPLSRRVFDLDGVTPVSGANFFAQLFYEDRTGTWIAHPIIAQFYDSSFPALAGYWNGSNRTLINTGGVPNPMDPTRALPVNMQVRVWDGGSGMIFPVQFDEAMAAGMKWGMSEVFAYVEEFDLPAGNDDTYMKNFRSFSLVPEPSTWALFALGMGWVVWRNRKGKS